MESEKGHAADGLRMTYAVLVARVRLFKDGQNFQNKQQLAGFSTQIKNIYHMI